MKFLPKLLFAVLISGTQLIISADPRDTAYHMNIYEADFLRTLVQLEENREDIGDNNAAIESLLAGLEKQENDHFELASAYYRRAEEPRMIEIINRLKDSQLEKINRIRSYNEKSRNAFNIDELNAEISGFRESARRALDRAIESLKRMEF